jgi:beta-mannanase
MNQVTATENAVGKRAQVLMFYKHWGGAWNSFYAQWINAISAHGAVGMITWMSDDYTIAGYPNPAVEHAYSNQQVIGGAYDAFIRAWADGLRATGRLVLLRFDHEMNGNWYGWSPGINGNTTASYVAMWRHVHDIFVGEGATNVRWVWSPNVDYPGAPALEAMYPGDAYVDWVALDGYNWGLTNGYTPWRSFSAVFGNSYLRLGRLTQKPVMIAEVGSVEAGPPAGQSKASWIASALEAELPVNFPRVRAFVWFDQNNGGGQDFRIASSPSSLAAFRQAINRSTYLEMFQG